MKIIALDDETNALSILERAIKEAVPNAEVRSFLSSASAIKEITENGYEADVVFLDIEMPGLSGLELSKKLKELNPRTNIVFVTGFSQYAIEAMKLYPSGYVMKPITVDAVIKEMENLRNPISVQQKKRIRVQTFGNFEIFCDNSPVTFKRSRSKEILAYLVDRQGTGASFTEIASVIWDDGVYDRSRQKQMQNYVHDIRKSLAAVSADKMLVGNRTGIMVDKTQFDCDYYQFLEGSAAAVNLYCGKYMSSYSWAEFTIAYLDRQMSEQKYADAY